MASSEEPNLFRAQSRAIKLLQHLGINEPWKVSIEDVAMVVGVLVTYGPLKGAEARLVRDGERGIIRVRAGIRERGRQRMGVAHELGHWEQHRDKSQVAVCVHGDIHGYSESPEELEATAFAAELLMPKKVVRERYGKAAVTLDLVSTAAGEMETTLTATAVRLVDMSKDAYMVVFSENGTARWWRASSGCPSLSLQKRQAIDADSVAHWVAKGEVASPRADKVAAAAWFAHIPWHERLTVYEQSMRLGSYATVMTILSISEGEE
jgi:Zn-dependent peptidase ImmA (M78 family)